MVGTGVTRIGGLFGVIAALAMISAYVAGSPDQPQTADQARAYYEAGSSFVTANAVVPLLHILFGIGFLGILVSVLRRVAGPSAGVYVTLVAGSVFFALTAAGFAAEVAYPAAMVRFGNVTITEFAEPLLTMAAWLYHYSQIAAAAMIFAVSAVIWRTGALPKWAATGAVLGLLPLVHTWIPLPAAISSLVWIGAIGLVMFTVPPAVQVESIAA